MDSNSLPSAAIFKLERLQQDRDDAKAAHDALFANIRFSESRCVTLANVARTAGTDAAREAAEQQLEAERDKYERLIQQRPIRDTAWRKAVQIYGRCEAWVERQRSNSKWYSVKASLKGGYNAEHLAAKRRDIADLQFDIERVLISPLDRKSIEALVARRVSELAASCRVSLTGERGDSAFDIVFDAHERDWHVPKPLEILAWFDAGALTAKLLAAIPEVEGISAADKAKATERLSATLLAAERDEEAQIEAAAAAGIAIERRTDADPRAVLGVAAVPVDVEQGLRVVA